MCGGLDPRANEGTLDPLQVRTMVLESQGSKIALVGADIVGFARSFADPIIAEIVAQTDIPLEGIWLIASHTHNAPYPHPTLYSNTDLSDASYLAWVAAQVVASVRQANDALQPATAHVGRSFVHHGQHHRRVLNKKDGKALNSWMPAALNDLDVCPQILGSVGPIDPELWVLRFDDLSGKPLGVFFNLSIHANGRGTMLWSADYPGAVAARMRGALGEQVVTVYAPGACADVNPSLGGDPYQSVMEYIATQALDAVQRARPLPTPLTMKAIRRDIAVPRCDPESMPPGAIERLNWGGLGGRSDFFVPRLNQVRAMPDLLTVPISALHIGPFALVSNPGELFVEYGLEIKAQSPFPHTAISELTNDVIMYEPTRRAFEIQGYETLVGSYLVTLEGIELIVQTASALLNELWDAAHG